MEKADVAGKYIHFGRAFWLCLLILLKYTPYYLAIWCPNMYPQEPYTCALRGTHKDYQSSIVYNRKKPQT